MFIKATRLLVWLLILLAFSVLIGYFKTAKITGGTSSWSLSSMALLENIDMVLESALQSQNLVDDKLVFGIGRNSTRRRCEIEDVLDYAGALQAVRTGRVRLGKRHARRLVDTGKLSSKPCPTSALRLDHPSTTPHTLGPVRGSGAQSVLHRLCALLEGQNALFVGPETTYHLHKHLLHSISSIFPETLPSCSGPEFCTFHHICHAQEPSYSSLPTERFKRAPRPQYLRSTHSAILRYVLSSTLLVAPHAAHARYTTPHVDPSTGIRIRDAFWLSHARRADVIVLNRGPVPAPAWTYSSYGATRSGNWSFSRALPILLPGRHVFSDFDAEKFLIVNAAMYATVELFLPSLLHTLQTISGDLHLSSKRIVWHGSWSISGIKRSKGHPFLAHLPREREDPWMLYYNAQGSFLRPPNETNVS
jgi:hypothetical protein